MLVHVRVQIDFQTYRNCPVADELGFLETCGIDVASPKFPIPVQPAQDFPELMRVIQVPDIISSNSSGLCSKGTSAHQEWRLATSGFFMHGLGASAAPSVTPPLMASMALCVLAFSFQDKGLFA